MISMNPRFSADDAEQHEPLFQPGDVIVHKKYGYRGVVVSVDAVCEAPLDWYFQNNTQPARSQPWYHVLVDGAAHTTYPAEENLHLDGTGEPITHPWLDQFFSAFEQGRYIRNETAWPYS